MSRDSRDAIVRSSPSQLNRPSSMATSTSRLLNADTGSIVIFMAAPLPDEFTALEIACHDEKDNGGRPPWEAATMAPVLGCSAGTRTHAVRLAVGARTVT